MKIAASREADRLAEEIKLRILKLRQIAEDPAADPAAKREARSTLRALGQALDTRISELSSGREIA